MKRICGGVLVILVALHTTASFTPIGASDDIEGMPLRGLTAATLITACRSVANLNMRTMHADPLDAQRAALCTAYIDGAIDQEVMSNLEARAGTVRLACRNFRVPAYVSGRQLADIVADYGEAHDLGARGDAITLVNEALVKAFPCK